jgi:isochorismate synthase EntC
MAYGLAGTFNLEKIGNMSRVAGAAALAADRRTALAQAGGGIVAQSDPDDELGETTTKFRTILAALGVPQ